MLGPLWLRGLVRRRTARIVGMALATALAVALFASLGVFFSASKAHMTRQAIAGVPVDWQVALSPGANFAQAARAVGQTRGVTIAKAVGYADTTYFMAATGKTVQTTGKGVALGLPGAYAATFSGEVRFLAGAKDGVLLAQQTAANLQAHVGSAIAIGRPGAAPVKVTVAGIVDLPAADSLFQDVRAAPGAAPPAPPDNVVLLDLPEWHRIFDPVARARPDAVRMQLHASLARELPPDPSLAFSDVLARAHNLEARLAGAGLVGDNLAAQLGAARDDAIYAQLLFLFLGLPGVILAAMLAFVAGASGRERRRREQALLRIRGATPAQIVGVAAGEAALVAVLGVVLGLAGAAVAGRLAFGVAGLGATTLQSVIWVGAAVLLGTILASVTILIPAWQDARELTVRAAQAPVGARKRPLWIRVYADVALLAAAGLIYWQSMRDAYKVVVVPEGIPTISINYLTLLAPIAFWIGSALLAFRLSDWALVHGRRWLSMALRPLAHGLAGVVAASMSRQDKLLSRALVIVALTISFAVSVAVFNTTYMNQARVDAELTNGADVSVTNARVGLPADLPARIRALPGVVAAQPMRHRLAYVGNDLQDLFGIDPATIGQATPMSDAYFAGGTASQTLARLAARRDAVLLSDETVKDYQLQLGDTVRLRLQFPSDNAYHVVPFHYVGVVREFPTAPRDSFIVANADYVARATGSNSYETLLIKTSAPPQPVASAVRSVLGPTSGATVADIVTELKTTLSSLTAIDLSGLTTLELGFAVVLAAAASGLVLVLGFVERARMFAIAWALGARARHIASFVWGEATFVTVGGIVLGSVAGWILSTVIVNIMTGVFDPPPEQLLAPWPYLGLVLWTVIVAVAAAGLSVIRAASQPKLEIIRDL